MHEEIDQAWRLMDRGYRIEYDASARMCHPAVANSRHAGFYRIEARNRVLLARRNLPWPLAAVFLLDWLLLTVVRTRSWPALREWLAGFAAGWRMEAGQRRPLVGPHHLADDEARPSARDLVGAGERGVCPGRSWRCR